ncbi:hypothetical protein [Clostridium butyricum]
MGVIIAFWSPLHGRGNTSNCIAAAVQASMIYDKDIFITHTHYTRSTMESAFLKGNEEDDILKLSDLGLDSINRAIKTGSLEVDDIKSYCNQLTENLFLISGSRKSNEEVFREKIGQDFGQICEFLKKSDNLSFIDIDSGYKSDIAREVIKMADIVVVTLDQTNILCEDYFSQDFCIDEEKQIIVMGRFDDNSKYTKKFAEKKFKSSIFAIARETEFLDALNNHRIINYFKDYYDSGDDLFFDELNFLMDELENKLDMQGISIVKKIQKPKKRFLFFGA